MEKRLIISVEVSGNHLQFRCTGFAGSHQRDSDKFDVFTYLSMKSNRVI